MKIEVFPATSYSLVYPAIVSLASNVAFRGKTVALIDFNSESEIKKAIMGDSVSNLYSEKVGEGMVFYVNIIAFQKEMKIKDAIESAYKRLKEKRIDIKIVLFPGTEESNIVLLNEERSVYKESFGEEETKHILLLGLERLFTSQSLQSLVSGLDLKRTYAVFVYERWQEYMVSAIEQRIKEKVSQEGFAGYFVLISETGKLPISFGSSREYEPDYRIIEEIIRDSERHPVTEEIRGAENIEEVILKKKIIVINGSSFSLRDKMLETIIERLGASNVILLNAGRFKPRVGIEELKVLPSFVDERFKGKNMGDVKAIAKRLAEEVIKNAGNKENIVLVVYETGNITPGILGYDSRITSYEFWNSFLSHINYNMKVSKIIFVCDPNVEACGPIEALADAVIMCKGEMENEVIIKTKE